MLSEEPTLTEVDGVPAVVGHVPGPLRAALTVRMGTADETAPVTGITHLLEHLALFGLGRPGEHSNGATDATVTSFYTMGEPAEVAAFLTGVSRQLHRPPVERLDAERHLLGAEKASRRTSIEESLRLWRYGARGFGLAGLGEAGLPAVDGAAVRRWAAHYATRGNVVLWFSQPPPAGIVLHLPDGEHRPAPDPRPSVLPELPAWYSGDDEAVGVFAVVDRETAGPALAHVLHNRLVDELRTRRAVAYSPLADYQALTGDAARLLLVSDLVAGRQSDGVRPVLAALGDLAEAAPPTEEELAAWRSALARRRAEPEAELGWVVTTAWDRLFRAPLRTPAEIVADQAALRAPDVQRLAERALTTAVAAVPDGVRVAREPWRRAPDVPVREPVRGVRHPMLEAPDGEHVIEVGRAGITVRHGETRLTVGQADAVAVRRWPDGRRVVIAQDASVLVVEPTLWADGARIVDEVDRLWPPDLWIPMAARRADEIPQPSAASPSSLPSSPSSMSTAAGKEGRRLTVALLVVLGLLIFVAAVVAGAHGHGEVARPLSLGLAAGVAASVTSYRRNRRASRGR